jgi:hypothetical protein
LLLDIYDKELHNDQSHFSCIIGLYQDVRNSHQAKHLIKHPLHAFSSILPLIASVKLATVGILAFFSALLLVQFTSF